jgi:cytoskeletal protein CcmA (bactofilin family)
MSPKPALQREPNVAEFPGTSLPAPTIAATASTHTASPRRGAIVSPLRSVPSTKDKAYKLPSFQPRVPVIQGEAAYRGVIPVDGIISGNLGPTGSVLTIKQKPNASLDIPELNGELAFKDMLRINGYVAGKISSRKGTLIVDSSARVDASIDVAVCVVTGTVNGDVVAQERVELGSAAVINGDISTASLCMKPGAIFTGNCRMIQSEEGED